MPLLHRGPGLGEGDHKVGNQTLGNEESVGNQSIELLRSPLHYVRSSVIGDKYFTIGFSTNLKTVVNLIAKFPFYD